MKTEQASQPTPTLDFRQITREPKLCRTVVTLHWDFRTEFQWILAGQCQIRTDRKAHNITLDARMEGATDREHDSAYAFQLPIIGHTFERVDYHTTILTAWINPNEPDDFRLSASTAKPKGYDLRKHPEAYKCKECKGADSHTVVPYFVPPPFPKLFQLVAGKRITIAIGPAYPEQR